ncbi:hypothetical protein SERLA73DRAFT_185211 [Serpula lacrymans var. lacrymans S7.3]|uniref:Uncharacterized protein n=1 Tax=Serpula lacrymans var. lacrymans (strain S7.3) TaxID=936435 RepID=F8Q499_SERL3|nr:hypothetical protein SERLA73DRAFT_185211 [Serpula lacrymans var. lacrymans S7.3]
MVAGVAIHHCKAWIIYQSVVVQMMLVLVDGLLMTRVYALWNGSRKIATILTTELIIEISCMCTSTFFIMSDFRPGPMCLFDRAPPQIIYFSVSAAVTQITLVVLTGWKQFTASRYGWGRTPLVSLVLRDGSFTAIVNLTIFCFPLMNILLEIDTNDIIFYWLLSILSICGCRLILNIHRLSSTGFTGENDDDDAFALTSMFSFLGVSDSDSKHSSTQSSSSS